MLASTARAQIVDGTTLNKFDFNQIITEPTFLEEDEVLLSGEDQYWVIGITMPTTVGNEANHKTGTDAPYIRFGVDVYASQAEFEEDSFGDDYDAMAEDSVYPYAKVFDMGKQTIQSETLFGDNNDILGSNNNPASIKLDASYQFVAPPEESDYDDWYADYEVTVTGGKPGNLTAEGNLPEGAFLMSGQYNSNDTRWQTFITPEVPMDTPIMLLKTAIEASGATNIHFTYEGIRDFVGTFNCGVKAYSDAAEDVTMQVALVLYQEDDAGNIIAKKTVGKFNYTFE